MDAERQKKSMSAHPLYHSTINKPLQKDKKVSKYAELKDIVDRHDDNIAILQEALKKSRVRSLQLLAVLGVLLVIITASLSGALVGKTAPIADIDERQILIDVKVKELQRAFEEVDDLKDDFDDKLEKIEDELRHLETHFSTKIKYPNRILEAWRKSWSNSDSVVTFEKCLFSTAYSSPHNDNCMLDEHGTWTAKATGKYQIALSGTLSGNLGGPTILNGVFLEK